MIKWFFIVYFLGANVTDTNLRKVTTEVHLQPTRERCIKAWRDKLADMKEEHPVGAVLTNCKATEGGAITVEPPFGR